MNIQSIIPDIAYTTSSAILAIQLIGTGSFSGSLTYEIRGPYLGLDQPFTASFPSGSEFGDTFETYPLGFISVLSQDSPAFNNVGSVGINGIGIIANENFNAYQSGTLPTFNAGYGG